VIRGAASAAGLKGESVFGTVCILYPTAGQEAAVLSALNAWHQAMAANLGQSIKGFVYRVTESERASAGSNELVVAIAFPDQATFDTAMNNRAANPHYQQLLLLLADEPIFLDGPIIWSS
jgi:hypothetical protein